MLHRLCGASMPARLRARPRPPAGPRRGGRVRRSPPPDLLRRAAVVRPGSSTTSTSACPPTWPSARRAASTAYLAYHTEAGTGYDLEQHTDEVEAIASDYPAGRAARGRRTKRTTRPRAGGSTPARCADLADRMDGRRPTAPRWRATNRTSTPAATHTAVHLDRGPRSRGTWSEGSGRSTPTPNASTGPRTTRSRSAPAEQDEPGSRCADPAIFLTRWRALESPLRRDRRHLPQRRRAARRTASGRAAVVRPGIRPRVRAPGRPPTCCSYRNAGHEGSPVRDANFDKVIRVYSGLDARRRSRRSPWRWGLRARSTSRRSN